MRLSFEQARLLNIDEDIIRRAQAKTQAGYMEVEPPRPKRAKPADGFDSKLERDFAECLKRAERDGRIVQWWCHPCGFRLAPKCYYHPDAMVNPEYPGRLAIVEVKGGWFREDSRVKIKVAAEMFPCYQWLLVFREKRNDWDVREVGRNGIGREPIRVPWIQ